MNVSSGYAGLMEKAGSQPDESHPPAIPAGSAGLTGYLGNEKPPDLAAWRLLP
jgi:hypothetical protein